jgi:acyl-CoA dehydrogenase
MHHYQSPWLNDELRLLQDSIAKFYQAEFVPRNEHWCEQGFVDRDAWNKAGAMGLLCASIPERYGGGGGSFLHDIVIFEEQLRAGISSFCNQVHSGIVAPYILAYGSEAQKQRWLPQLASGAMVAAVAMTEPGTGSDLQAVKTTAQRAGDDYLINGSKTFITNGYHADLICVVAKTDPAQGAKGISLLMLETAGLAGFRRGRPLHKIGQTGQDTVELFFDDVRVPTANLLGSEEGQGFAQLMQQLPRERLIIASGAVAMMQRALEHTIDYVKQRKAFGQRLLDFQNTRFKLAEAQTEAHIARVFVDDCIQRLLGGTLDAATAAMAKWWTTQKQCDIVDECLQLHGGYGYMLEYPIAQLYADSRVQKIYGGANEIMKELIAREL